MRSGIVWVNTFLVRDLTAPFGGIGISGIGREGGDYALDFHSDLKTLQIADDTTLTLSSPECSDQATRPAGRRGGRTRCAPGRCRSEFSYSL